ncbi:hypothetical protein [Candidatus Binatus sp.]|uniref:hypothetical protein n=1 Tax=Candidatus Binatus sp. TaxID=2811406 RepID=UPI003C5E2334
MTNVFELNAKPKSAKAIAIHEFSEEKLALDFVNEHRHEARFVGDLNEWFVFDGTCWRRDQRRQVFDWARDICRRAGAAALAIKRYEQFARSLTSAKARYAVSSLASDDQSISMLSNEFDADPLLLGAPTKTVCLGGE